MSRVELPTSSLISSHENVAISSRIDATSFFESCKACNLEIEKALLVILALSLEKYASNGVIISENGRSYKILLREETPYVDCVREICESKEDVYPRVVMSFQESFEEIESKDLTCHVNISNNNIITFHTKSKAQVPGIITQNISQRMIFYVRALSSNIDVELRD